VPVLVSKRSFLRRPQAFTGEKRLERWALKRADRVLGNSSEVISELQGIGIPKERLTLIRKGIELGPNMTDAERKSLRSELGWPPEDCVLLVLANLMPFKGHLDILRAAGNPLLSGRPHWCGAMVGSGAQKYTDQLRSLASELGIAKRIIFMGQRKDGARLAAAIDGLLASPHLQQSFGQRSQQLFDANYTIESCVKAYDSLYRWLLSFGAQSNGMLHAPTATNAAVQ
jgi:glycosyltransferase involved in cell wall biosynthesis